MISADSINVIDQFHNLPFRMGKLRKNDLKLLLECIEFNYLNKFFRCEPMGRIKLQASICRSQNNFHGYDGIHNEGSSFTW